MTHRTIGIYYTIIGIIVLSQTVVTVISGGSIVLNSTALAELKKERQTLLQTRQVFETELTKQSALTALPEDATLQYIAITHPIVLPSSNTVASTQP